MLQRLACPTRTLVNCRILATTCLVAAGLLSAGQARAADDPTGDWRVADGVANIRVAECNGAMWGVVVWEKTPGGRDKNNPDVSKQNRPTLGMPVLLDMKKKPRKEEWDGHVYNAKDGKTYESSIKLLSPDQLEIKGCVLGFLCGGETWTRVAGPIPPSPSNTMNPPNSAAKGAQRTSMARTAPKAAPKTTGQRVGTTAESADPVGDICLLPDIARPTH
ncbi:MAG TPA: DUF2147 domain-containing protein [Nitrobacter sp.]|nr:DUF2147 domain-containing protein [Nitrobacter sp.]